jgi:hypothetical protein
MLCVPSEELAARREAVTQDPTLAALAARLRRLLEPMLTGSIYMPEEKALLSRDGGICPTDGARLTFDPLHRDDHACPQCGAVLEGERHRRAWIWRYHLWLSERAIHLGLLSHLLGQPALRMRAKEILQRYAAVYPTIPNRDNVLGPTRLFFSTYLESLWLTQMVIAASLIDEDEDRRDFRSMVEESAALIASFDEAWSNRQVWNNAALVAAGHFLGREDLVRLGVEGRHGLRAQLQHAVTDDGLWFEGENYHFFALRGLLLGGEILRAAGVDLYADPELGPRLGAMYRAPLDTALPDLSLPARGDAPYGVSLRQPRFADLWEIARVRAPHARVDAMLSVLYALDGAEPDDVGFAEIAEQEQNRPPMRLSRERLGWKALLWMCSDPPPGASTVWHQGSRVLPDAGVAVLRDGSGSYASLECGGRPGGHGHPDLLHLTLFHERLVLGDFGTGSYVNPSLHWYRSTLAHNAPGVAGSGQWARAGYCAAFASGDRWQWCRVAAQDVFGPETTGTRTVVLGPDYAFDAVDVEVPSDVVVDLPIHPLGGVEIPGDAVRLDGGGAGHAFSGLVAVHAVPELPARVPLVTPGRGCAMLPVPRPGEALLLATAPGPPDLQMADGKALTFLVRRARGRGRWMQVYELRPGAVEAVHADREGVRIDLADGSAEQIKLDARSARVVDRTGNTIELTGAVPTPRSPGRKRAVPEVVVPAPLLETTPTPEDWPRAVPAAAVRSLGAQQYRRSELTHEAAGGIHARVALFATGSRVGVAVLVEKRDLCFHDPDAPGPELDNEAPDIHSDGIQWYLGIDGWQGFVVVPDPTDRATHVRVVSGTSMEATDIDACWGRTRGGYSLVATVETHQQLAAGDRIPMNVVVNEMYPDRARRAGQLALTGGGGWVYLRGDRESPSNAVVAEVT